jgi:hypothetical protein
VGFPVLFLAFARAVEGCSASVTAFQGFGRSVCGLWQAEQLLGVGEVDAILRLR